MATDIGKAYVQIIPSAQGIKANLEKTLTPGSDIAGKKAGKSFGSNLLGMLGKLGIGVAVGKILKDGLDQGGALQQSLGGIETLFKGSSDKMKQYATQAYKTSGLSANAYMENVTSFSASLIQSLGGNTSKAADVADMAMRDMSDNMNKMGTPMEAIQNAYQGFAKQNYTMLDNLKLGYGGTKTEMQRLLADATKLTGQKYDINNLSDVYEAIHAIQGEIGITGTTAKEAQSTLTGSFGMIKGAFQDLLGDMALGGGRADETIANLTTSVVAFRQNMVPMLINVLTKIPTGLITALAQLAPQLGEQIPIILTQLLTAITEALPMILTGGVQIIQGLMMGLIQGLPTLIAVLPTLITSIVTALFACKGQLMIAGIQIFTALIGALPTILDTIVNALPTLITGIINFMASNAAMFLKVGLTLFTTLVPAIIRAVPTIVGAIPAIIKGIVKALVGAGPQLMQAGKDMLKGLVNGIKNGSGEVFTAIKDLGNQMVSKFKEKFKIHSPSKVFADEIGRWIPEGIGRGIMSNTGGMKTAMNQAMDDLINSADTAFNFSPKLKLNGSAFADRSGQAQAVQQTINIYQPVKTPGETARVLRQEAVKFGLAGA